MEMKTLLITKVEDKDYQGIPYKRVLADGKWYSSWDSDSNKLLEVGNTVQCELGVNKKGYPELKRAIGLVNESPDNDDNAKIRANLKITKKVEPSKEELERNKQAGVSMRYAVDLCIHGKIEKGEIDVWATRIMRDMKELAESDFDNMPTQEDLTGHTKEELRQ